MYPFSVLLFLLSLIQPKTPGTSIYTNASSDRQSNDYHYAKLIADKYDITVNNVWVIIFRAKAKLREDLTDKLEMAS